MQAQSQSSIMRPSLARALCGFAVTLGLGLSWPLAGSAAPDREIAPVPQTLARPAPGQALHDFRIVAFGSSSTQGVGATSLTMTYPAQVERLFDDGYREHFVVSVLNRGIGGEDIDDMLKRLRSDVMAGHPDLVLWQVGSNDPLRGVPIARFKAELRTGLTALRESGTEVMLMEPQWCPTIRAVPGSSDFVDAVRDIGAEQHVDVIRRYDLMQAWINTGIISQAALIGPDGLHMTDRGYTLLAKEVFEEIVAKSKAFRGRMDLASSMAKHS